MNNTFKLKNSRQVLGISLLTIHFLLGSSLLYAQETMSTFTQNSDSLVVYKDVPGLAPSEFYSIKVRSAATNNEWVDCYANITRSLWSSLTSDPVNNKREYYYTYVKDWSHTYANIEMNRGSVVEVQIAAKNGFKIRERNFETANALPAQKASKQPTVENNIVYFTINNPCQITIDINGQMDDVNTGNGYSGPAIHTVSLFANPVIKKPKIDDPGVLVVNPGSPVPTSLGANHTLFFAPGVHDMGRNYKLASNKNYYIPGDAIVYGTVNNIGLGAISNVRIFGYGTLSGDRIKHPSSDPEFTGDDNTWTTININNCSNFRVEGICNSNPPYHSIYLSASNSTTNQTFCHWVKVISWRCNGDGIGSAHETFDCFIRTQDDCSYVKGDKKRCVFWTDVNGAVFMLAGMPAATQRSILIEDCDVIYPRHCSTSWAGGRVFSKRSDQAPTTFGVTKVNVTFKDIRITDKFQTLETFHLKTMEGSKSSGGFSGITFQNITAVKTPLSGENKIVGHSGGPWDDLTFDNVVLGSKRFTQISDFAVIGSNVTNVKFINPTAIQAPVEKKAGPRIYTNPSSNSIIVDGSENKFNKVEIVGINGMMVYSNSKIINYLNIDISGFVIGLYFVRAYTVEGVFSTKVVKL